MAPASSKGLHVGVVKGVVAWGRAYYHAYKLHNDMLFNVIITQCHVCMKINVLELVRHALYECTQDDDASNTGRGECKRQGRM